MTKEVIAEQVLRIIYGGDIPSGASVEDRDVFLVADQVYAEILDKYITISGEDVTGEFVSVYPKIGDTGVEIKKDTVRDMLYAELPARMVNIKNGRGLREVSPIKDERGAFPIMQSGHIAVTAGLESEDLNGQIGCWLEGSSVAAFGTIIVFNKEMTSAHWLGKFIMVKMISDISSLGERDEIHIPALLENEFRDKLVAAMGAQRGIPEDSTNDNRDIG